MKSLTKILFLLTAVIAALPALAQTSSGLMISPQTNEILSPTPSSAQQIRYQSPQPALATGAVNLSVPLYTIEAEGLSIPFSLSYHTSGIKPLDDPYPCGYGWSMLPALKIVRTVRGRADEQFDYWGDKLFDYGGYDYPKYMYACMVGTVPPIESHPDEFTDRYDSEKDIFTISLPSGTYNRIYQKDENGTISFLGGGADDEIVVTADSELHNFYVRDAQGFVYHFGEKGSSGESCAEILRGNTIDQVVATTCWGIIDISLPSGRRIDFKWEEYKPGDKKIYGGDIFCDSFDALYNTNHDITESERIKKETIKELPRSVNGNYFYRIALSSVSFPGGNICMSYKKRMLDKFTVVTSDSDTIRTINMHYGSGDVESLFLKKVEISGEGTYKFEYDPQRFEDMLSPYRQDWWGYYNGKEPLLVTDYLCLSPFLRIRAHYNQYPPNAPYIKEAYAGHADRSVDEKAMQAGILKKIVYPTGGFSTFDYETHRFPATKVNSFGNLYPETDPELDKGGGLRIKKICTYSGDEDQRPHVRTYQYDSVEVTAVPSAATFVSVAQGVDMCVDALEGLKARYHRQLFINHTSDYMQNHIGEDAIWYRQVTEVYDEGKTVHRFDYPALPSLEKREWGRLEPIFLENVFTHGAVPVCTEIYKKEGGDYKKVETTKCEYEITGDFRSIANTHIIRNIVNMAGDLVEAPDFINGTWFLNKSSTPNGYDLPYYCNINYVRNDRIVEGAHPYWPSYYHILLQSDRLKSKTVTRHLENGDYTQTETYEYMPGTSIVTSVKTTNPADSRKDFIRITYPSEDGGDIERRMVAFNMIGIPVKTTHVFGNDSVSVRREMDWFLSRVFRPAKEWQSRGACEWLAGSYDYDSYGNLRQYMGVDSVPTTYLWGYSALHPVYKIDGAGYKEVCGYFSPAVFRDGSAEKGEINIPAVYGKTRLVTKALWKPLVGITSMRQPCGLTTNYDYDYAGRLIRTAIDGYGPLEGYSYHTNENGLNYMTRAVYHASNTESADIQEIVNYDGLGRESSRLTKAPNQNELVLKPFSLNAASGGATEYTAVLTEYDTMDRPFRKWGPVNIDNIHPSVEDVRNSALDLYGTEHAYETTFYEASPAGIVCGSRKAGEEWHQADRRVSVRHLVNKDSGDYSCPDCYTTSASARFIVTDKRVYPAGALTIEEVTDEEGHVSMTFTDRRGKTVMIREGASRDWNDTRFVYNDYGDLLFVIQPESSGNVRKTECFRYEYDSRGNCTLKGIPGGTETRYRYDARNRLFAEQDSKMKNDGVWLIHHYDNLGRPAFSAYAEVSNAVVESLCAGAFTVKAPAAGSVLASNSGGYVCPDELALKVSYNALAEAHYYDSYDCFSGLPEKWGSFITSYPVPRSSTVGLETATAAGRHIRLKAYDDAGRVIREAYGDMTQNPEMETRFRYDYQGNVIGQIDQIFKSETVTRDISNTYYRSGHLYSTTIRQNEKTARITHYYDEKGNPVKLQLGDNVTKSLSYNANGWLTSATTTASYNPTMQLWPSDSLGIIKKESANPLAVGFDKTNRTVIEEILHYADETDGVTPRYDGKIAARSCGSLLTAYGYDSHGRLASSQTVSMQQLLSVPDYSTSYTYDRNANITSLSRLGIVDRTILGNNVFGLHSRYTMKYAVNQLSSMEIEREGEDYEGRTGVGATGKISDFWYDANGNLGRDMSRGILSTDYNRLNLPTDVYFINGHRQTIEYDGFGQKRRVSYSQTSDPILGSMMGVPEDSAYTLQGRRDYIGTHVFVGDSIEYSAFPGGYFTPEGVFYYITDWQGNNIAVFSDKGALVQQTTYYPYGEPTIEPTGQRYLFGGKEREHAGGRNSYDFGPRNLGPSGNWDSTDRKATENYPISPFSYCNGDPINYIDPDGKRIIFINGFHSGDGGSSKYWSGIDRQIMDKIGDHNALYYDGSIGGSKNLAHNLDINYRHTEGFLAGYGDAPNVLELKEGEKIEIVTHSMGAAYAKGFIDGIYKYAKENEINMDGKIDFELDLAPYQSDKQTANPNVPTFVIHHLGDGIASPNKMPNANCKRTHECYLGTWLSGYFEHQIKSYKDDIEKLEYNEQTGLFYKD